MLVETSSSGMPSKTVSMSRKESMATPAFPTSPEAMSSSESYPIWVGRSNAIERPVCPSSSRYWKRSFVSTDVPIPAYWRIVQSRPRYPVE
jgi:hypothetical protein